MFDFFACITDRALENANKGQSKEVVQPPTPAGRHKIHTEYRTTPQLEAKRDFER